MESVVRDRVSEPEAAPAPDSSKGKAAESNAYFNPKQVGPATLKLWDSIVNLGLQPYIGELDVKGYTVVPPEIAQTTELYPRTLEKLLDVVEERTGERPDMSPTAFSRTSTGLGQYMSYLLFEDEVFVELLLNPVLLTFLTYLVGENAQLSSMTGLVKGQGDTDLTIHSDNMVLSAPFPVHNQICNVTFPLTPYGPGNGPICFVPGSHKMYRHPALGEADDQRVTVEAEPGSFIIFHGNTWHGAVARTNPGFRVNIFMNFARPQLRTSEAYREDVTEDQLNRYPPRFTKLMGRHTNYGWRKEGPADQDKAYAMGAHAYD
jgi:hypothetical protein